MPGAGATTRQDPARVLVVDDEPDMARGLAELLAADGYRSSWCACAEDAVTELDRERADVVISDVRMDGLGGLGLLEVVRQRHPGSVVVMFSAHSSVPDAVLALRRGAFHYVTKPFRVEDMRKVVAEAAALARAQSRSETDPYRLLSRLDNPEFRGTEVARLVRVGPVTIGGDQTVVIAGPCAVESREQTLSIARAVQAAGAHMLRGGAYKPRTSPYEFQGLGVDGLKILAEARDQTGLPVVTEVMDPRLVDTVAQWADMLQIGSRSMQNFPLLREVGRCGKPVLLKRGFAATLKEWLCAAEYIACEGNLDIVLCERGIRTFSQGEYNRNSLDLNVIAPLRRRTYLPVCVDPSHATGDAAMVPRAAMAGAAEGAHALIIEVIDEGTDPGKVLCDGTQSIRPSELARIVQDLKRWKGGTD